MSRSGFLVAADTLELELAMGPGLAEDALGVGQRDVLRTLQVGFKEGAGHLHGWPIGPRRFVLRWFLFDTTRIEEGCEEERGEQGKPRSTAIERTQSHHRVI